MRLKTARQHLARSAPMAARFLVRHVQRAMGVDRRQAKRRRLQHANFHLQQAITHSVADGNLTAARQHACAFITAWPAERDGYRHLADLLSAEGDSQTARDVYLGRLPDTFQAQHFAHKRWQPAEQLSALSEVSVSEIHPSTSTPIRSTAAYTSPALAHFAASGLTSTASRLVEIHDSKLWYDGFNTIAFDPLGNPVPDGMQGNLAPVLHAADTVKPVHIRGTAVLLGARGSTNWFHWLTDILPKLGILQAAGHTKWADMTFIVPGLVRPFHRQTLASSGIQAHQVHETSLSGCHISTDRLLLPLLDNRLCLGMGHWQAPFIQSLLGGRHHQRQASRKLFVSRDQQGSGRRLITNLDAVHQLYTSYGYEIIYPDRYSVTEQAEMFAAASHVAGPHGAGLANILFCKPGTVIQELYGSHLAPCYWAISEICNFDYSNCPGVEAIDSIGRQDELAMARNLDARRVAGFEVPLERLEALLSAPAARAA